MGHLPNPAVVRCILNVKNLLKIQRERERMGYDEWDSSTNDVSHDMDIHMICLAMLQQKTLFPEGSFPFFSGGFLVETVM